MVSQAAALTGIRALLETVPGIDAAYSMADEDREHRMPAALGRGVSALVFPASTREFVFGVGSMRHTYEVEVWVLVSGDSGVAAAKAAPLIDELLPVLVGSVSSQSGLWNSMRFVRSEGAEVLEWGDVPYQGYKFFLEVSEQGSSEPGVGA